VLNGKTFGVPHWVCGTFLFFRKNDPDADRLSKTTRLGELEQILSHPATEEQGLLADMRGKSTLGEVYLSSLVDEYRRAKEGNNILVRTRCPNIVGSQVRSFTGS
jgi:hypothetical protein